MTWFVLELPEPGATNFTEELRWTRISHSGAVLERGSAPLVGLSGATRRGDQVLALVPGERVLIYHVSIPARSRSAQLQALPFALEDRLSEDLETMHIVPGQRLADGRLVAAVAAHRDMDFWLGMLREAGLRAAWLLPDTALLPPTTDDRLQVYCTGADRCLISDPDGEPLAVATELLPWWLARSDRRSGIDWHGPSEGIPAELGDDPDNRTLGWDGDLPALLAPALRQRPKLNLLSGRHSPAGSGAESWTRWRLPAAIVALLALLWTGLLWLEVWQLEREVQRADLAITALFEDTLPNTRMVDPKGQFRQVLDTDPSERPSAGAIAVRLGETAPVLAEAGIDLRQLRADAGRMELEMDLDSIATLDSLRTRLRAATGATVRILSADSDENGVVRARLQIEGNQR